MTTLSDALRPVVRGEVEHVLLSSVARIVSGGTPKTGEASYWNGDIPWATPRDLSGLGSMEIHSTPRSITEAGLRNSSAEVLPENSVLFSSRAPIGLLAINTTPMATNQGFKSFVPDPTRLDSRYLFRWLEANRAKLQSMGVGATFKEVSKAIVSRLIIPLPPLDEQRRIAAILEKADELRTKRRQALAYLDVLPQSIFMQMFGDPIANDLGLPVAELQTLLDKNRPLTYGILMPGPDQENGVKYVRVTDMQKGRIQESTVRSTTSEIAEKYRRSMLRPGDLLMSIRGHVGRFAVVPASLDGANITQDTARLAVSGAEVSYVRECLSTPSLQRWMVRHTKGVAVRGINLGDVRRMPIPIASVEKQQLFARKISSVERLQDRAQAQLAELNALFAALQYRAFRAER